MNIDLRDGCQEFCKDNMTGRSTTYKQMASKHEPSHLIITCVDARVNPMEFFQLQLGEALIYRNVGNIVPEYQQDASIAALLELAVLKLKVGYVHVMGHSDCGAIHAIDQRCPEHLKSWVEPLKEIETKPGADRQDALQLANIDRSIANLQSYPWVKKSLDQREINIMGWHIMLSTCAMRYKRIPSPWTWI
ncbi:hypothetical protein N9Y17_04335 [Gammaproteobacteria bacterium]|nr:hypothetical protein [Gammaproteobacteria bacterium]